MKDKAQHIIKLLRRWIGGDIRSGEEKRLEEAAGDDPFLRDALEGYRRHPEADHAEAIKRIKGRLEKRNNARGGGLRIWLPRTAAAAAVLMLIGATFWYINLSPGTDEAALTQSEAPAAEDREIAALEPSKPSREEEASASRLQPRSEATEPDAPEEEEVERPREAAPLAEKQANDIPAPALQEEAVGEAPPQAAEEAMAEIEEAIETAPPEKEATVRPSIAAAPLAPADQSFAPARSLQAPPSDSLVRTISGKVTTVDGEPVIGASIVLPGTTSGTVTDLDGQFEIEVPAGQPSLIVSYVGLDSRTVRLGNLDSVTVQLEEGGLALDEVVVTGIGARQAKASKPSAGPIPEKGWKAFERYLKKNLQYPEAARRQEVEGTVMLSFDVQADGTLSNFEVIDSLGYGLEEEAIRLLQEGPAWQLPANRKAPVSTTYPFLFELR